MGSGYVSLQLLTLCMLGNFSCFLSSADFSFKTNFVLQKNFQEYYQSVKQFGSRSCPTFKLFANVSDTRRQRVNIHPLVLYDAKKFL